MPGIDLLNQLNPLTAYQFDRAVTTFGRIIANAIQETVEVGSGHNKTRHQRYTLAQLLDDTFALPRKQDEERQASLATLKQAESAFYDEVS